MSSLSLGGPASGGVIYVRRLIGAFGALPGGLCGSAGVAHVIHRRREKRVASRQFIRGACYEKRVKIELANDKDQSMLLQATVLIQTVRYGLQRNGLH